MGKKRLLLYGINDEKPSPFEIIRPSENLDYRILNQSHMSMMVAPEN